MAREDLQPVVNVAISGNDFGASALEFVQSVKVELALDKADLITLVVANPIRDKLGERRTSKLLWTDAEAWMPGNILEVSFVYGDKRPSNIFGGIVKKWMPRFPRTGVPTIRLKALDGSSLMMDGPKSSDARTFDEGTTISDMVRTVLGDYEINTDNVVDVASEPAVITIKKAGMNDYIFVRGLAHLLGFEFRVKWDHIKKQWAAIFAPPIVDTSNKKRFVWGPDFEAGDGDALLLDFSPEFATHSASTDIEVFYFDRDSRTWEKVIYPEKDPDRSNNKANFQWKGDDTTVDADLSAVGDGTTGRGLRIKAGGVAVEVVPANGFRSAEEAFSFAKSWWEARQSMLLQGTGTIIGWPDLLPGQVHELGGIGPGLEGDWYFAEVTHTRRRGSVYESKFLARKVIP